MYEYYTVLVYMPGSKSIAILWAVESEVRETIWRGKTHITSLRNPLRWLAFNVYQYITQSAAEMMLMSRRRQVGKVDGWGFRWGCQRVPF